VSGFTPRLPTGNHRAASIGAILGRIEGNRPAWGSLVDSVDDGFE